VQYLSLTRQTPPAVEPVTVAEAKAHLRVDTSDDDTYIGTLVTAAREWVESYLDRTLVNTQWRLRLHRFPTDSQYPIYLPRPPVVSSGTATAVTITYTAETGGTATLSTAEYRVQRFETPGRVTTVYGGTWPASMEDNDAVVVTWWAGYGASGSSVPAATKHAILMLVGHWYDGARQATVTTGAVPQEVPFGVKSLLDSQRWGSYQ
jgi:uncharacterized phiE125 gp8 family phage protein